MKQLTEAENKELNDKVTPFMSWLFTEPNPIALNTLMAMTGTASPVFRSPYYPYDKELRQKGIDLLSGFDEKEIYGGRPQVMEDGDFKILTDWTTGIVAPLREDMHTVETDKL